MKTNLSQFRRLEINGGRVEVGETVKFVLPTAVTRYTDAQIDDYGRCAHRRHYPWHTGTALQLKARFSHAADPGYGRSPERVHGRRHDGSGAPRRRPQLT